MHKNLFKTLNYNLTSRPKYINHENIHDSHKILLLKHDRYRNQLNEKTYISFISFGKFQKSNEVDKDNTKWFSRSPYTFVKFRATKITLPDMKKRLKIVLKLI